MRDYMSLRNSMEWYHDQLATIRPTRYVGRPGRTARVSREYATYVRSLYDYMTFLTPNIRALRRNGMLADAIAIFDEWNALVQDESGLRVDIPASWRGLEMRVQGIR